MDPQKKGDWTLLNIIEHKDLFGDAFETQLLLTKVGWTNAVQWVSLLCDGNDGKFKWGICTCMASCFERNCKCIDTSQLKARSQPMEICLLHIASHDHHIFISFHISAKIRSFITTCSCMQSKQLEIKNNSLLPTAPGVVGLHADVSCLGKLQKHLGTFEFS